MFRTLFEENQLLSWPVVSMLAFMAVFAGVVVWVFAKRRKPHYDRMAQLPLADENDVDVDRTEAHR